MKRKELSEEMRPEYNFDYSKAVRGKYYRRILKEGSNVVVLEPDVAKAFPNSAAVNDALRVVLADIRAQGIREIFCLGDIVGYGPNPCECLDEVIRSCKVTILGNHDQATLFDPEGFNPVALAAIYWTRDQLENGPGSPSVKNKRWDFLGELRRMNSRMPGNNTSPCGVEAMSLKRVSTSDAAA